MKTLTKKLSIIALAVLMLFASLAVQAERSTAGITYNNMISASVDCSITSSGKLTASMSVAGIPGTTTKIGVELSVGIRVFGTTYMPVFIGYPNNVWTDSVNASSYNNTFSINVPSHGRYKVTVIYTVEGTGGAADVVERSDTAVY